jgi:hypothetical protein
LLLAMAVVKLLIQLLPITRYGYFRDELYYLACARHLAWGYPDQPPLSIAVLAWLRPLIGDSLPALRVIPALLGAATVYLTGLLVRDLGGGRRATLIACLAVIAAPIFLGTNHVYSMNSFDLFFWPASAYLLLRALREPFAARWALLGVVLGLGLLNKISLLWLGAGFAAGLLVTAERRRLATVGPWLAGAIALLLFAPYVLWNAANGWPAHEFIRNAIHHKMVPVSPMAFALGQVLSLNPGSLPIWLAGLVALLLGPEPRRRILGIAYLVVAAILILPGTSKPEYLAPASVMLFAAGGVAIERWSRAPRLGWLAVAAVALPTLLAAPIVPVALPVLSPDAYVRYSRALGITPPASERHEQVELPQHYADMFGWEEMAARAAAAFRALPPEDRGRCVIVTQNYGEAGALEHFGARLGLPRVVSGHNAYAYWGYGAWDGSVAIVLGGDEVAYRRYFEEVTRVGTVTCRRCMAYERDLPIYVLRRAKVPVAEYWAAERHLD